MGCRQRVARVPVLLLVALLPGCGANTLRLESAGSVSTASTAVVETSRAALVELRARRQRANVVIVASDPSCGGQTIVHIRLSSGDLCADVADPGGGTVSLDVRPLADASVQPTLVLVAALADYAAVLQKVVGEPKRDIGAELAALAGKAATAKALADGLLGTTLPDPVKALATKQAQSAIKLAQFAANLAQEAGQTRRVRAIVATRDAEVGAIAAELDSQIADWLKLAKVDADDTVGRLRTVYDQQIRRQRPFEARVAFLETLVAARSDSDAVVKRAAAMAQASTLLGQARAQLSRHLAGNFSEAERRRIATIERGRILEAVKLLAEAAIQFV